MGFMRILTILYACARHPLPSPPSPQEAWVAVEEIEVRATCLSQAPCESISIIQVVISEYHVYLSTDRLRVAREASPYGYNSTHE